MIQIYNKDLFNSTHIYFTKYSIFKQSFLYHNGNSYLQQSWMHVQIQLLRPLNRVLHHQQKKVFHIPIHESIPHARPKLLGRHTNLPQPPQVMATVGLHPIPQHQLYAYTLPILPNIHSRRRQNHDTHRLLPMLSVHSEWWVHMGRLLRSDVPHWLPQSSTLFERFKARYSHRNYMQKLRPKELPWENEISKHNAN